MCWHSSLKEKNWGHLSPSYQAILIQAYADCDLSSVGRAIPHVLNGISVEVIEAGDIVPH